MNQSAPTIEIDRRNVQLPPDVHKEIKIEAANLGCTLADVVKAAWDAHKLAHPQPWRAA